MAFESNSPNMNMPVPGVSLTSGPQYASDVNACLSIIDQHNHSPGSGAQITPAGLNINTDLSFNNTNNLIDIRSVRFNAQSSPLAGVNDLGCIYVSGVDLYYNDENGNQIQITLNGGIAGTNGSIANLTPPASASYVAINSTFVWQSNVNTPANMDAASYIFRNLTANSFGLTLNPPAAMGADFSLTLPNVPVTTSIMQLDSSGAMSAVLTVDNVTIDIAANQLEVKDDGISTVKIQDGAITTSKLASDAVQNSQMQVEYLANTTFNVPAGVTYVYLSGLGGGGGGGGGAGSTSNGAGGGGGEGAPWYEGIRLEVTPGAAMSVVIGAAGAGGGGGTPNNNGASGTSGTATIFGGRTFRGGIGGAGGTTGPSGVGGNGGFSLSSGAPSLGASGGVGGGTSGGTNPGTQGASNIFAVGGAGGASGNTSGGGGGGGAGLGDGGNGGNSGGPTGQPGTIGISFGAGGGGGGSGFGGGNGGAGAIGRVGYLRINWFESI